MPTWLRPGRRGRKRITDSKSVFTISPPDDTSATKYVLIVYRGGAFGARPAVVGIDKFEVSPSRTSYKGFVGDDLVIEFPGDTNYLLISSKLVHQMSAVEAAQKQKAEE